jgi:hypothetical protein
MDPKTLMLAGELASFETGYVSGYAKENGTRRAGRYGV